MKIDLNEKGQKRKKVSNKKRKAVIVIAIVAIFGIFISYYAVSAKMLINQANSAKSHFDSAQELLKEQNLSEAKVELDIISNELSAADKTVKRFNSLSWLPYLGNQIFAVNKIIDGGEILVKNAAELVELADEILSPFRDEETISLASLSQDDKGNILSNLNDAEPKLIDIQNNLRMAYEELKEIPRAGLIGQLTEISDELNEQLPALYELIENAIPLIRILPDIAGHPDTNKYLFLLQNNAELRPTGGFIGTYGVIEVNDGEIIEFSTDNVYNLDSQSNISVTPPEPLIKYIRADKWFLRDANWSPDFPTSAEQAIWFYEQETRTNSNFDGVIAITPSLIAQMLLLTDPITVYGVTFNSENFYKELQYQVSEGFLRQGISFSDRKDIIGELGTILITKILSLPQEQWSDLWNILLDNLTEKQFLLYMRDEQAQELISNQNWSGEIKNTSDDYLTVVDANLASLKTDPSVERKIYYKLDTNRNEPQATVQMTYNHVGEFNNFTTRYRTYVRIYVPEGSSIINVTGNDNDVITNNELGKTVFETFMSIEPGESEVLEITYKISQQILDQINAGQYKLLIQKQPGTFNHDLVMDLNFDKSVKSFLPEEILKVDKKLITYQTDLRHDEVIMVNF
ncbi:DUF4012 domain-containing protein [Patescibacteria group bacterium]